MTSYDYATAQEIRLATEAELRASLEAAQHDGGAGAIQVDGRTYYVTGELAQGVEA